MADPQFAYIRGHFTNFGDTVDGWTFWTHESEGKTTYQIKIRIPEELLDPMIESEVQKAEAPNDH